MAYQSVDLTLVDQEILNSYSNMIEGLACYLGEGYEIVPVSYTHLDVYKRQIWGR